MVFSREFKQNFGKCLAWFLVVVVLTGLLLALYPMMLDVNMKSLFDSFVGQLSPSLQKIFGFDREVDYTKISEYIAFIYQYMVFFIAIFAMQLGASSLSKDLNDGSIQYIYSNPISRVEIVTQKFLADILLYFVFLLLLFGATFFIVKLPAFGDKIISVALLIELAKIFLSLFLTGSVLLSIGMFFSSLSKSTNYSEGTSVLFVIFLVIFVMFGKIYGGGFLNIASFVVFEAFHPIDFLQTDIYMLRVLANIIIFIIMLVLTYTIYNNKDLEY